MARYPAYVTPELIIWARRKSGLTRSLIALRVHVTVEKLRLWERGTVRPTFNQAIKFAEVTDTPFGYLFLSAEFASKLPQNKTEWHRANVCKREEK